MPVTLVDMQDVLERGGISVGADGVLVKFGKQMRAITLQLDAAAVNRLYHSPGNGLTVVGGVSDGPLTKPGSPTSKTNLEQNFLYIKPGEARKIQKEETWHDCIELKCEATKSVADVRIAAE